MEGLIKNELELHSRDLHVFFSVSKKNMSLRKVRSYVVLTENRKS